MIKRTRSERNKPEVVVWAIDTIVYVSHVGPWTAKDGIRPRTETNIAPKVALGKRTEMEDETGIVRTV